MRVHRFYPTERQKTVHDHYGHGPTVQQGMPIGNLGQQVLSGVEVILDLDLDLDLLGGLRSVGVPCLVPHAYTIEIPVRSSEEHHEHHRH